VAALCKDPDRVGQVLARIEDPAVLAQLATDFPSSRVRQAAAAAIDDPAQLHELLPRVRGKDKSVYKLIKQKCDALHAEQRKAEEAAREVTELCASLERHSTRAHDSLYATTLETLAARWSALPARPDAQIKQRAEQALERCREVIAAHERDVARQAAARAAEREAEREARKAREPQLEAQRLAAAEPAEAQAPAFAAAGPEPDAGTRDPSRKHRAAKADPPQQRAATAAGKPSTRRGT